MKLHLATTRACLATLLALGALPLPGQGGVRRVIVTLRSTNTEAAMRVRGAPPVTGTELAQIASRLDRDLPSLRETGRAPFAGMLFAEVSASELAALASDPNVGAVEEDRLWSPIATVATPSSSDRWAALRPNGTAVADETPWGVARVTAPEVWAAGNSGAGVKVAVMDSGIDLNHPDLQVVGGYNAVTRTTTGFNDDLGLCNGHGTHIAGTIAARANGTGLVGVAPSVELYAIRVFQDVNGQCLAYTSNQIAGLNWAVSQGIRLVNVSIGGSMSTSYNAAIATAAEQGTFLIAAAGNNGGAVLYPAAAPSAIAIAALDASNARASFSSNGPEIGFAAPGVSINSTMPGGGYGGKSGTSMATPHVVGVAALILAAQPGLSLDGLRQKLRDGALDLDTPGFDNNTGWGLVRAQQSLGNGNPPPPPPPVPLTLTVSPASRRVVVVAGSAAPGSNAAVTLAGDNSTTTAWSAAKRKSWTTLTTGSGTGSGTVAWNRSAAGLAAGTYVDTITVSAAGVASRTVIDSLVITAAPVALTMSVSPSSRSISAQVNTAVGGSSATITLAGDNSTTTAWSATKQKNWTTLTTASGTGSGAVAWNRSAAGLAAGTYVDTITVSAAGVASRTVIDSLVITAAPVALTMSVSPSSRSISAQVNTAVGGSNATVTLAGDNSTTTAWSATKQKSWTTLTTGSGTGSGTVAWNRSAAGLAAGTYVDTITVSAAGVASRTVIDSLVITAAPVPLTLAVSPASRSVSAQVNTAVGGSNATVTLAGDNSTTTAWSATKQKNWTTLTTASGTGSGTVAWSRSTAGLTAGAYVDTITVSAAGVASRTVIDSLVITAAPAALTMSVSPSSRSVSAQVNTAVGGSNATVTLAGDNSTTTAWSATKQKNWTTLTTASGTGSGTVAWNRSTAGLAAGTYVDTITVSAAGVASRTVIDSLVITAAPVPLTLAVSPASRSVSAQVNTAVGGSNATVTLAGDNRTTTAWSATKQKNWTTLTTASGTGSGAVAWSRSTAGLAAGTYVDTITVSAAGVASRIVIDSLVITAAPVALTMSVSPPSRMVTHDVGGSAASSSGSVTLTGDGAGSTLWTASKRKNWTTLTTGSGTGGGTVVWSRNTSALAAGTYVDTITVTAGSLSARIVDSIIVRPTSTSGIAFRPKGKRVRALLQAGSASSFEISRDSALVEGSVIPGLSSVWIASANGSRILLHTPTGELNQYVRWERRSVGTAPAVYIDTIRVQLSQALDLEAIFVDTLEVVAVQLPEVGIAVEELVQGGRLNDDQRQLFDRDGNRNGLFDIGDFLAWVDRARIRLSPAQVAQLQSIPLTPVSRPRR